MSVQDGQFRHVLANLRPDRVQNFHVSLHKEPRKRVTERDLDEVEGRHRQKPAVLRKEILVGTHARDDVLGDVIHVRPCKRVRRLLELLRNVEELINRD